MLEASRFPIGDWAWRRKGKRQVLVEANKSIQELERKITEVKRKVSLGLCNVIKIIDLGFCDYL